MPLNSVQVFVKQQLDNLPIEDGLGTATKAYVSPPIIGDMATNPLVFVWGAVSHEMRETMAGGRTATINTTSGIRTIQYELDIYIKYAIANDNPNEDNVFPLVVDSVMQKLRGIQIPTNITDPVTNWPSVITDLGERFSLQYAPVMEAVDQRFWVYEARIVAPITEKIQQ